MFSPEVSVYFVVFAPLIAALIAGVFGKQIGHRLSMFVATFGVFLSAVFSARLFFLYGLQKTDPLNIIFYTWLSGKKMWSGIVTLPDVHLGFLIDSLSSIILLVVSFVSLIVHIYSYGYMHDDPSRARFFSYIALFTFSMLLLVSANNLLQLFFGWELVGLVSYLLIGFWFKKPSATAASLKAFLVNRVGDVGFVLGIAALVYTFGTFDYAAIFSNIAERSQNVDTGTPGTYWPELTFATVCLFIGAMAKSAQIPLQGWLPDSMEGPTPISALIHAATMVTAGIYMVARLSPVYELTPDTLQFVMLIGAATAFFMGLIAIVQDDIKRIIAYSTISQLGYMVAALGAHAYAAAIFHLVTHAFFKALLFLAAGSVIIAMHHEQNIRKMGGLYRYLPITWLCFLLGSVSLIGFPGTAGFFSKEAIIASVHLFADAGEQPGFIANASLLFVTLGVLVTALYTVRLFLLVFHGQENMNNALWKQLKESNWIILFPLILLAVPSLFAGILLAKWFLSPEGGVPYLHFASTPEVWSEHGAWKMLTHALYTPPLYLLLAGLLIAWLLYNRCSPIWTQRIKNRFSWIQAMLVQQYGFDVLYQRIVAAGAYILGGYLSYMGDKKIIDGYGVHGLARLVNWTGIKARGLQTGYLYHYAVLMVGSVMIGLFFLLQW